MARIPVLQDSGACLVWRDLLIVARAKAVWMAAIVHLAWLGAFVVIWIDGVPVLEGSPLAQTLAVDWALLVVLLPWVAARGGSVRNWRHDLVISALATGRPVSELVAARCVALTIGLVGLCATGLPAILVAARASDANSRSVLAGLLPAVALSLVTSVIITAAMLATRSRVSGWLAGSVTLWLAVTMNPGGWLAAALAPLLLTAAVWVTVVLQGHAGPYVPELTNDGTRTWERGS